MSDQVEPVYQFEKRRATVRAYITAYRGKRYAHIREFVERHGDPGAELVATKSGICVEIEDLDDLRASVEALASAIAPSATSTRSRA